MNQVESNSIRRWRPRFSLKLLLLVVSLASVALAVNSVCYHFENFGSEKVKMTEKVKFFGSMRCMCDTRRRPNVTFNPSTTVDLSPAKIRSRIDGKNL